MESRAYGCAMGTEFSVFARNRVNDVQYQVMIMSDPLMLFTNVIHGHRGGEKQAAALTTSQLNCKSSTQDKSTVTSSFSGRTYTTMEAFGVYSNVYFRRWSELPHTTVRDLVSVV